MNWPSCNCLDWTKLRLCRSLNRNLRGCYDLICDLFVVTKIVLIWLSWPNSKVDSYTEYGDSKTNSNARRTQ